MDYKKPQSTLVQGGTGIYPLTTADQVILTDGSRLEKDGKISADSAANSAKLGGKAPEYYIQPRNLLDNSDFRNPVNQRGYTTYNTLGYTIDRWLMYFSDWANFTLENGLVFNAPSTGCSFYQRIAAKSVTVGAKYTLAYMMDGDVYAQELVFEASENESYDVAFIVPEGTHTLLWAVLYEGSYTADTLPPYVPKGYASELAECQRYFERIGKSGNGRAPASMLLAVGNTGEMRVLQGYRVPKRIISPTIMLNGKAVGETVSIRNSMTNDTCAGVLSLWNNTCADRLNTLTVAGTSVIGAVYEGYLDIIADL